MTDLKPVLGRSHGDAIVARKFDRGAEDVGNILALEHLNLTVPDQAIAAMFYVSGLGFTRDPYVDFGVFNFNNMWVNVGDQQFHLPQGKAQHFRGTIGLTVPDLDKLRWRLDQVRKIAVRRRSSPGAHPETTSTSPARGGIGCAVTRPTKR